MSAASMLAVTLTGAPAIAQLEELARVEMPTQPLNEALGDVGNIFGVTVIAPDALVRGKTASAVSGSLTAEQAVTRLLRGSGLTYRRSQNGGFIVEQQTPQPEATRPARTGQLVEPEEPMLADSIVVTGTKLKRSLQETPQSVVVFTDVQIEEQALFTIEDLLFRTPNVTGGNNADDIAIRGISRSGIGQSGQGVTSNIYIDGAPLSTVVMETGFESLWDVEQVEILRGPQSSIQGRNALAGGVFITTKDPTYDWEFAGRALAAELGTRQVSGAVSGPILDDQVAFRIAADYFEDEGSIDLADGQDYDFTEALSLRGKLLVEPDILPGLRAEIIVDRIETEAGAASNLLNGPVPIDDPAFSSFDIFDRVQTRDTIVPQNDNETWRTVADIAYAMNDVITLRAIGTYEDTERSRIGGDPTNPAAEPLTQTASVDDFSAEIYSGELRVEFDFGRVTGLFGGYYYSEGTDTQQNGLAVLQSSVPFPVIPEDTVVSRLVESANDIENFAFFASAIVDLTDRWSVDFKLRYDNEEFSTTGTGTSFSLSDETCVIPNTPVPTPGGGLVFVDVPCPSVLPPDSDELAQRVDFDAWLPSAVLTYRATDDVSVFASVQRGYRAGGTFLLQRLAVDETTGAAVPGPVSIGSYDPEFILTYEVGLRSQWLDRRLTINANAFYSDYSDQQQNLPQDAPFGIDLRDVIVNAGQSEIYGAELSVDMEFTDGFSAFANLGLLEAEFTDFPYLLPSVAEASPELQRFVNLSGNDIPQAPSVTASFGLSYEHPTGLFFQPTVSYTGSRFTIANVENLPEEDLDSFTLVNMRLGYRKNNYTLFLFGTNVFDAEYIQSVGALQLLPDTGEFFRRQDPPFRLGEPRVLGGGIELRF
ncbi:MAG: TonB-dependent receptor [Pseudomonadota bacterium]